jgi:hypothetical protein
MLRNLKALGLTWALISMGTLALATAAHATPAEFKADTGKEDAIFLAEQDPGSPTQMFTTAFTELDCETFGGGATQLAESAEISLDENLKYQGHFEGGNPCSSFEDAFPASVDFNGCRYEFNAGTTTAEGKSEGTLDIVCPAGKAIEFTIAGGELCVITVFGQTGLGPVKYRQISGSPSHITAEIEIDEEIAYEAHEFLCETGLKEDGSYESNLTIKAFTDESTPQRVAATLVGDDGGKEKEETEHAEETAETEHAEHTAETPEAANFAADSTTANTIFQASEDPDNPFQEFLTDFWDFKCKTFSAEGTAAKTADTVTATNLKYAGHFEGTEECEALSESFGFEWAFNGCDYVFHAGDSTGPGTSQGTMDLVCPSGKQAEAAVAGGLCTVTLTSQIGLGPVAYHEVEVAGANNDVITAEAEVVDGIAYEGHGLFCETGPRSNGDYFGSAIVKAFNDNEIGAQVDATIEP